MVEEHHRLKGHEFEQTLGDSEAQGSLVCGSPWGHREADTTWRLNNNTNEKTKAQRSSMLYPRSHS